MLALLIGGRAMPAQHEVTAGIVRPAHGSHSGPAHGAHQAAAVFWLEPMTPGTPPKWTQQMPYQLQQKNRTFSPHLLVVPAGSLVNFPNADPFFHNVFSMFDGKRFDLGLYEAGTSKGVRFERRGVSYIFCNIHPEMSAVVVALDTPLWSVEMDAGKFRIAHVPEGEYEAHMWVEGEDERTLAAWTHRVSVKGPASIDGGTLQANPPAQPPHLDKFGRPYKSQPTTY